MPFANPVVGGDTLIRAAIRSPNYAQGLVGWAINADGSAEFNNVSSFSGLIAKNSFEYQGVELSDYISSVTSKGVRAVASLPAASRSWTTEKLISQCTFLYEGPGREYAILFRPVEYNTTSYPSEIVARARYQFGGGNVTLAAPAFILDIRQNSISNYTPTVGGVLSLVNWDGLYANNSMIKVALTFEQFDATGGHTCTGNTSDPIVFEVVDLGPRGASNTTVDLYTSPTAPSKTLHTFATTAIDSQSYRGSGVANNGSAVYGNTDRMYFGQDPADSSNGNWRSYCLFNKASTGTHTVGTVAGTLNDMVGVATTDVAYLDIYEYVPWWYQIAGGTLHVGMHGWTTINHSAEPGGTYHVLDMSFGQRGAGEWVSVLGTQIETAVLNGSFTGLILGPGNTTSFSEYGYGDGAYWAHPQIRAGYYK